MASTLRLLLAFALVAAPVSAQVPAESQLTRIGAAAAVAGQVLATAPNTKVGRVVGSGKPIFLNDHVTTSAAGRLQVKMAANVVKGTFRFVSGKMSHETGENMKIHTPSGTMGIRGTIAAGEVADDHTTFIGGNGSNLAISGKLTDSANINVTSFPSATGPAVFNLTSSNFSNSNFTSATVQLKNAGGVVARDVGISFSYSNTTGDTASGSATGTNRTRLPPQ